VHFGEVDCHVLFFGCWFMHIILYVL
jgi:hypothetical protein